MTSSLYTVFLLSVLMFSLYSTNEGCNSTDQLSLLAFKSMINQDPFKALTSWNLSSPYCLWNGVICGKHHPERVVALHLDSLSLSGSISPALANLTFLQSVSLSSNRLTGEIPTEFGRLHRLKFLNLSLNSIHGAVPSTLGNISSLEIIDFQRNRFQGDIPSTLSHLSNLQVLNLRSNLIGGEIPLNLTQCRDLKVLSLRSNFLAGEIPLEFGYFSKLAKLVLGYNNLTGTIPENLGRISSLEILDLPYNSLTGSIPSSIGNLSSLAWLDFSFNHLSGIIPLSLGNLGMVSTLQLTGNRLNGTIPSSLGNISALEGLGLGQNNLQGEIPASFGNLLSLNHLDLPQNSLSGEIPNSIGQLSNLIWLNLGYNNLMGKLPGSLYNLSNLVALALDSNNLEGFLWPDMGNALPFLEMLRLSANQFSGPIPASLLNSTGLADVEIMGNNFTGMIPPIFGNLPSLYYLDISDNELVATKPSDWDFMITLVNCTYLQNLNLGNNYLGGELPSLLVNLSASLNYLALDNNQIDGTVPLGIGKLVDLTFIDMSNNLLQGIIPNDIGNLLTLESLDLSGNKISGEIQYSINNLSKISRIFLSNNNLEGSIPEGFGKLLHLELMNLSYNKLIGNIPKEVIGISSLSNFLDLSHNQLNGTVPAEIGNLKNVNELVLSHNRLSGVLPTELGNCEILEILYMENNMFEGTIPSSFGNLRGLQVLDLSHNMLNGQLPNLLEELPNLQILNLSFNKFEGEVGDKGIFSNSSAVSLRGNTKLCGGIPQLNLPKCSSYSKRRKHISNGVKIILFSIGGLFLLLLIILCFVIARRFFLHPKAKPASAISFREKYARVSYAELFRATNGFSLVNLIGTGSFGSVYKGNLVHDGISTVAVKVINLDQHGAIRGFDSECESLRHVRHRNLLKILTTCVSLDHSGKDFRALVFEYMPNGSLDEWIHPSSSLNLSSKRLSLIQRLNIAIDIASALEYLHHHQNNMPIVHCDLKPSNILLDSDFVAHVGDFGLAKILSKSSEKSTPFSSSIAALRGSIGYVPPEYGIETKVSTQGDVYSYGILLLEMFTGKRPTDDMFKDGMSLRTYVQAASPDRIMEIIDKSTILTDGNDDTIGDQHAKNYVGDCMINFLVSLIECGLLCSKDSPRERPDMERVVKHVSRAREIYHGMVDC
ncbi:receptor kinase-like protein Xa21 [Carex rostrata]